MAISSTTTNRRHRTEIEIGGGVYGLTFSANGKYLLSGHFDGVQVWRVEDGKRTATMRTGGVVFCLAVSKNDRYIAAGTNEGHLHVWDADTHEKVFEQDEDDLVNGVDFSLDSLRLLSASDNKTASIWNIATCKQVQTLHHHESVLAAKYSPEGDRIATGTRNSVHIYDSSDARILAKVNVTVSPWYNTGLVWTNGHLLVVSNGKIAQIKHTAGSPASEWPVHDTVARACIVLPKHGKFIAYSAKRTISFWDAATHAKLGIIQHSEDIHSIAFSPDDYFIAIGDNRGKVVVENLSRVITNTREQGQGKQSVTLAGRGDDNIPISSHRTRRTDSCSYVFQKEPELESLPSIFDSFSSSPLLPTFLVPDFHIDNATLNLWKQDRLINVDSLLTTAITTSRNTNNHLLASRALVRTRLQEWDTALEDAEKAINVYPCPIAYIAKSIALVGKGRRHDGYRTCDIAFAPFHSTHVTFFLLIKAIIVAMAGEHLDAISRIDDLVATVSPNPTYNVIQAYMYLLVGKLRMESSDYDGAIESFRHARAQSRHDSNWALLLISLISGWKFDKLDTMVQQCLCESLYAAGRTEDAVKCFHDMTSELAMGTKLDDEHVEWAQGFGQRACQKLEHLGDAAADAQRHDEAISHYTTALSLDLPDPRGILIKRGKTYIETGCWEQALDDANQVIDLDPMSPWGYEIKHAALHKAGDYDNALYAFETMLLKMEQSLDPDIHKCRDQYETPSRTRTRIHRVVKRTLRDSPRVLINTVTGVLCNRAERASAFESLPIFKELVSSMTTRINRARIKHEVRQYFQYVMLSHKWEENEPLFEQVIHIGVYDLNRSPTHDKLQMFCKIVHEAGFNWAWSDTCCIDTGKHDIHQEALVAMFKWYRGSALMVVFLRGVSSASQLGALAGSIWNTRGWTLQEYIAARVIHFYTDAWTPYLNLELANHKEAPEVIAEMEQATGVSSEQLITLRPGLTSIREKLRLASTRQTERVEDAAYSLLGIFSVTGIPAIYGEGDAALGRLLSHILTASGDVSVLAWTGESGSFNSCLPARISVFNGAPTSHLPSAIPDDEMERIVTTSYTSSFDLDIALRVYSCLEGLPLPSFATSRMKLPCIAFQLPPLPRRARPNRVYRVDTIPFGLVEIRTKHDLSRMESLYLVHPWLDSLLEQAHSQSGASVGDDAAPPPSPSINDEELSDDETDGERIYDDGFDASSTSSEDPEPEPQLHPTPVRAVPMGREMRARRLAARLRQPFGALLVASTETGRRVSDYRRVAADSLITVAFQDHVSLSDILDNVRTLDVL